MSNEIISFNKRTGYTRGALGMQSIDGLSVSEVKDENLVKLQPMTNEATGRTPSVIALPRDPQILEDVIKALSDIADSL